MMSRLATPLNGIKPSGYRKRGDLIPFPKIKIPSVRVRIRDLYLPIPKIDKEQLRFIALFIMAVFLVVTVFILSILTYNYFEWKKSYYENAESYVDDRMIPVVAKVQEIDNLVTELGLRYDSKTFTEVRKPSKPLIYEVLGGKRKSFVKIDR